MPKRKTTRALKAPANVSLPVDQEPVQGVTDDDITSALASLPTYRFNGACGPYKTDDDMSAFERWCLQTGRDDLCSEASAIYDGSRDAFNVLMRKHGVERAYSIVDSVAAFADVGDRATPDFGCIIRDIVAYVGEKQSDGMDY